MQLDVDFRKTLRSGQRTFELEVRFHAEGERVVVVGPSGAGKSMMLKVLAGLVQPDAGHVQINGDTLFDAEKGIHIPPQARAVAYLFQDYALFPHLNVRQNIAFGAHKGWRNPLASHTGTDVERWLDVFGLNEVAHQYPHELSGGQRQRTALARALMARPRALLLDEPFTALDTGLRTSMRAELDTLQRSLGVPMVLITHDPEDVRLFGDQVLHMHQGRLVRETTLEER